ncbi:MAG TPA: hypothetical protein VD886_25180 [Herpetosiphonaceae bacterium]|nr:hypothetical protein [Herpetosiphonaceae bacterium]
MWNYLTQNNPPFLTTSWAMGLLVLWIFVIVGTVIWMRSLPPKNPVRQAFRKRTSTALLIIAGVGVVQMVARMIAIPVLEWRLWGWLLFIALLGYALFAYWDASTRLPARVSNAGKVQRVDRQIASRKPAPASSPSVPAAPSEPRPEPITGRRDARRAKKRRK